VSETLILSENDGPDVIEVEGRIRVIGECAFAYTNYFSELIFSNKVELEIIGPFAFCHSSVRSLRIPRSVERIGASAFARSQLRDIEFEEDSRLDKI
jgi:hypothetical protein